jgi:hypothetical protein
MAAATTPLTWTKAAHRVYTTRVEVCVPYRVTIALRLDGRGGRFYRADMTAMTPWEAIDGGEASAPANLREGKALAARWLVAAREQGTLTPRGV